jgi:hypothetical protein
MRILLTTISFVLLALVSGCSALQTLEGRGAEALETAVNPEQREIHYFRDGNTIHYLKRECSGRFCDAVAD